MLNLGQRQLDLVTEYTGHPYDQVLGLYFAQARMYDAAGRRFVSADIIKGCVSAPNTLVRYIYAIDNPLKYIDPDGRAPGQQTVVEDGGGGFPTVSLSDFIRLLDNVSMAQFEAIAAYYGVNLQYKPDGSLGNLSMRDLGTVRQEIIDAFSRLSAYKANEDFYFIKKYIGTDMRQVAAGLTFDDAVTLGLNTISGNLNFFSVQVIYEMYNYNYYAGKGGIAPNQNWYDYLFIIDPRWAGTDYINPSADSKHAGMDYTDADIIKVLEIFKAANNYMPTDSALGDYAEDKYQMLSIWQASRSGLYYAQYACSMSLVFGLDMLQSIAHLCDVLQWYNVGHGKYTGALYNNLAQTSKTAASVRANTLKAGNNRPTMTSAAVDGKTGNVYYGDSGTISNNIHPTLRANMPSQSLEDWAVANCAEFNSINNALNAGAKMGDLFVTTVRVSSGVIEPLCRNCTMTTVGANIILH